MFKEKDRVYDIILGKIGSVNIINNPKYLPILVYWDDMSQSCNYTTDGRFDLRDSAVRLYLLDGSIAVFHIPPKEQKKVKVYKWVIKVEDHYEITSLYYRDGRIQLVIPNPVCRIDDSMTEFDE
jgi:hypothetical protein